MKISELIDEKNINLALLGSNKEEIFYEMAESLFQTGYLTNTKKFVKDLFIREKECSTGIGGGFAIPHAKSKHVKEATIAIGRTVGIKDYETMDGSDVNCIFMIAVPKNNNDIHLTILSSLARKMMDDTFKNVILSAKDSKEVLKILSTEEV